nr:helix-turn-helix transcriptional regulator [Thiosulfatihalobacter marinus]
MWRVAKTIRSKGQEALCQALVDARNKAGLSQQQLAARLKRPQSFVARLESGERRIDVVEFTVLARVIGFDKDEVLSIVEAATEPDHKI